MLHSVISTALVVVALIWIFIRMGDDLRLGPHESKWEQKRDDGGETLVLDTVVTAAALHELEDMFNE